MYTHLKILLKYFDFKQIIVESFFFCPLTFNSKWMIKKSSTRYSDIES